jgi:hypothetical protein
MERNIPFNVILFFSSLSYVDAMSRSKHLTNVDDLSHLILYDKESAIEDVIVMHVHKYIPNCDKIVFISLTEFSFK